MVVLNRVSHSLVKVSVECQLWPELRPERSAKQQGECNRKRLQTRKLTSASL